MKTLAFTLILLLIIPLVKAQDAYEIETVDIDNFWNAYDKLKTAESTQDSIAIVQTEYIEKASEYFQEFIKVREFTAQEYVEKISLYPEFWNSVRPLTENIKNRKGEVDRVLQQFKVLPNYDPPNVCFAIGCLRTGGTVSEDLKLIGSEIVVADKSTVITNLPEWLQKVIPNLEDFVPLVAHEIIHTQEYGQVKYSLLRNTISEGVADFITEQITGLNVNYDIHAYGNKNECQIWKIFEKSLKNNPDDWSEWLFNRPFAKDNPGDLGYLVQITTKH